MRTPRVSRTAIFYFPPPHPALSIQPNNKQSPKLHQPSPQFTHTTFPTTANMSTTPTASSNGSELGLTEHDRKFLETAITCLKSPPEVKLLQPSLQKGLADKE